MAWTAVLMVAAGATAAEVSMAEVPKKVLSTAMEATAMGARAVRGRVKVLPVVLMLAVATGLAVVFLAVMATVERVRVGVGLKLKGAERREAANYHLETLGGRGVAGRAVELREAVVVVDMIVRAAETAAKAEANVVATETAAKAEATVVAVTAAKVRVATAAVLL